MFITVEGGTLINVELVDRVELDHIRKTARLWAGGITLHPESKTAYGYFSRTDILVSEPEQVENGA